MKAWYAALALLAGVTLTACSKPAKPAPPPPPLAIGSAPARPTGHVRTGQPLDPYTGYAKSDRWPSACDLLTDADIRSILPQVKGKIDHQVSSQEFDFDTGGAMDVPNADCEITFRLPGVSGSSEIDADIEAVGAPTRSGRTAGSTTGLRRNAHITPSWLPTRTTSTSAAASSSR